MRWNPFLTKRGRIIVIAVVVFLLPVGYLASYPIAYRLLLGSDTNNSRVFSYTGTAWQRPFVGSEGFNRYEAWLKLQRYCFPAAEWLLDHAPIQRPLLAFAWLIDVDEQLNDELRERELNRALRAILRTGNRTALLEFLVGPELPVCKGLE